jgi:hypothetical protein
MSGYPFGPGGYGMGTLNLFRNQYHAGRAKTTGSTRDVQPESFNILNVTATYGKEGKLSMYLYDVRTDSLQK